MARPPERAAAAQAATRVAAQAAAQAVLELQEEENRLRCHRLVLGSAAQAEALPYPYP